MEATVLNGSYYIPLTLINPFNRKVFPYNEESVLALIDTGFDGFIVINRQVYKELEFENIKAQEITIRGICCEIEALKLPVRILLPDLNLSFDGEAIYYEKNKEIIVGTEFLSYLKTEINGCKELVSIDHC